MPRLKDPYRAVKDPYLVAKRPLQGKLSMPSLLGFCLAGEGIAWYIRHWKAKGIT